MVLSDNNTITQDNAKHKCIGRKWALKPIWPVKSKAQKIAIMGRNPKVNVDSVCSIIVLHESMVAGKGWRNQEKRGRRRSRSRKRHGELRGGDGELPGRLAVLQPAKLQPGRPRRPLRAALGRSAPL